MTKGAPQVILELSANESQVKTDVDAAVDGFAARGFRSLGVARAEGDGPWNFVGVLPLFDPPREDAKATIATAFQMGVDVKMVTGDALAIARETAKTLGMGTDILDAAGLGDVKRDESAATAESIDDADGFAQVFPEHKFHIVDVLQKRGHIVGMTGDGVNDAPALKKADCGIAVSDATDAARAAASIVLTTPGLSVIIDAIKESRRIFQRMNSYAIYRIAETLRVLLFVSAVILIYNFFPVTAIQIVMLALLNDGAILSIAYDNVRYRQQPEAWNMRLVLGIATVLGVVGPIAAFGLFYLGDKVFHLDHAHLQTLMYLTLSVAGHLTIFLARTRGPFWSIRPARVLLLAVLGTQALATLIAVYGVFMTPLGWGYAALVWGYALVWFLLTDRVKLLAYRILDPVTNKTPPMGRRRPPLSVGERPERRRRRHRPGDGGPRADGGHRNAAPSSGVVDGRSGDPLHPRRGGTRRRFRSSSVFCHRRSCCRTRRLQRRNPRQDVSQCRGSGHVLGSWLWRGRRFRIAQHFQYFAYIITIALYATGFAAYAVTFIHLPAKVWAVGVVLAFTAVNFLGSRLMGRAESVIVIIKVAMLPLSLSSQPLWRSMERGSLGCHRTPGPVRWRSLPEPGFCSSATRALG